MSSLAILLCIVLFASAENAPMSISLQITHKFVKKSVNVTMSEVQTVIEASVRKAQEVTRNTTDIVNEVDYTFWNQVLSSSQRVIHDISNLNTKAESLNATGCIKLTSKTGSEAYAVIENAQTCTNNEKENIFTYIEGINSISKYTLVILTVHDAKIDYCSYNVHDLKSMNTAIHCIVEAGYNATSVAERLQHILTTLTTNLDFMVENLRSSIDSCLDNSGYSIVQQKWFFVIQDIKNCIQSAIGEDSKKNVPQK